MSSEQPRPGGPPADLGPYVAWLAQRLEDETTRRRCRVVAEAYLDWLWADGGPASTRRSRFVPAATRRLELAPAQVEDALDRFAEHRDVVAQTLPTDR